jgi:hypothetical protein
MAFNEQNSRYVKMRVSANQSIAVSGTPQAVSFDTVVQNPNTIWVVGTPTRFTCNRSGWYFVVGQVEFAASATGDRSLSIQKNGAGILAATAVKSSTLANTLMVSGFVFLISDGTADYLELVANQTSGGALNLTATAANESPSFSMTLINPTYDPRGTFEAGVI